jgi:hypothetical protein
VAVARCVPSAWPGHWTSALSTASSGVLPSMNGGSSLPKTCTVEGCDGKFYAKGRCRNHWHQEWRRQDRERGLRAACAIEGCDKPYVSRGWCEQHYNAWKRHRDPLYRKQRKVCTVPDCDRKHSARGWCELHYARWKAHGDPLQVYPQEPPGSLASRSLPTTHSAVSGPLDPGNGRAPTLGSLASGSSPTTPRRGSRAPRGQPRCGSSSPSGRSTTTPRSCWPSWSGRPSAACALIRQGSPPGLGALTGVHAWPGTMRSVTWWMVDQGDALRLRTGAPSPPLEPGRPGGTDQNSAIAALSAWKCGLGRVKRDVQSHIDSSTIPGTSLTTMPGGGNGSSVHVRRVIGNCRKDP